MDENEATESAPDTNASAQETTPPAPDPRAEAIDSIVESWWSDHMPGSILARSTEVWNHVYAAKEVLKSRLRGLL